MNLSELVDAKANVPDAMTDDIYAVNFELMDGFKNYSRINACGESFADLGEDACTFIETCFINLMKQATYEYRYTDKIHYLMPIEDDEEYGAVEDFLKEYRSKKDNPTEEQK